MGKEEHKVLKALDVTKTQWYHFTAIVVAGMGFFTDAYDLFSISLVTKLLGRIYYTHSNSAKPGTLPPNVSAAVNGVAFCGTLLGQLFFGWLEDKLGRKKVYGATLIIMAISSVASGLSFGHEPQLVIGFLCVCRFCLGFGIGGDYPLSATIMSEYSNKKTRGAFIAAVFAMQGLGNLTAGVVAIIVSAAFKSAFPAPAYEDNAGASLAPQADYVWRIILMFGGAPALLTFYWRMKMPETARYTALVANNAIQAASDMSKAITAGILVGCSDFAAQKISGVKKLQFKRLFLLMIYGFFYSGPFGHFFHKVMDKIFKGKKGNTTLGQKVILEQLTASPWNNLCFMMYYGLVVEARTWSLVKSKVKKDYPSIQLTSWKFWPIINWVNYQYMPLQLRVLFHNLIASCWAIFLNLKARSATTIKKA